MSTQSMLNTTLIKKLFIIFCTFTSITLSAEALETSKINFLLNQVKKSQIIFIRNNKEYSSQQAHKHLKHKLSMAQKRFWFFGDEKKFTAMEFITKVASKSSSSGKKYYVKLNDGSTLETKEWFLQQLKKFKNEKKKI